MIYGKYSYRVSHSGDIIYKVNLKKMIFDRVRISPFELEERQSFGQRYMGILMALTKEISEENYNIKKAEAEIKSSDFDSPGQYRSDWETYNPGPT